MPTIKDKIGAALPALEAVRKALNAIDEAHAEAEAVQRLLDARRNELAETEGRLVRANEEFAKTDADHARWRQAIAKQQSAGNAQIDQLQTKLQALEQRVSERQAEHDNIVAGISVLTQRLKIG